jgi:hypothetical protein
MFLFFRKKGLLMCVLLLILLPLSGCNVLILVLVVSE